MRRVRRHRDRPPAPRAGAGGGTGARAEPPGTGALDALAAFRMHQHAIFGFRADAEAVDYSALQGFELYSACSAIDRRYAAELPQTMMGQATSETVAALERIVADYRRLALEAHRFVLLDGEAIDRKIADSLKSLARTHANLGDDRAAERSYDEARDLYRRLADGGEASSCDEAIAQLQFRRGGDVDSMFTLLHSRSDEGPLDRAERELDLADLHFSRNDDFEAETHLRSAESVLAPLERQASGTATADALVRSMTEIMGGGAASAGMGIEETVRLRTLLSRLYRGLARVAPDQARDYLDRLTQLEGSIEEGGSDNAEFSQRMLSSLEGLFEQFDRGRRDPP